MCGLNSKTVVDMREDKMAMAEDMFYINGYGYETRY